jgi:hypothetical protein
MRNDTLRFDGKQRGYDPLAVTIASGKKHPAHFRRQTVPGGRRFSW